MVKKDTLVGCKKIHLVSKKTSKDRYNTKLYCVLFVYQLLLHQSIHFGSEHTTMKLSTGSAALPSMPFQLLLITALLSDLIPSAAFVQQPASRVASALYATKDTAELNQRALLAARLAYEQKAKLPPNINGDNPNDEYSFLVGILGDLHIDPRKMEDYETGRGHFLSIFDDAKSTLGDDRVALVSLGDLGESKNCDHNPDNPVSSRIMFNKRRIGTVVCYLLFVNACIDTRKTKNAV